MGRTIMGRREVGNGWDWLLGEGPQMAGAADGGADPVLVRQRPVLRLVPDRAGAQRAYEGGAGGAARAAGRGRGGARAAPRRRGGGGGDNGGQAAARPAGRASPRRRGPL